MNGFCWSSLLFSIMTWMVLFCTLPAPSFAAIPGPQIDIGDSYSSEGAQLDRTADHHGGRRALLAAAAAIQRLSPPPKPPPRSSSSPASQAPAPPLRGRRPAPPPRPPVPSPSRLPPAPRPSDGSDYQVCGEIILMPTLNAAGKPTFTFEAPVSCRKVAAVMVRNLTDAARAGRAPVLRRFALESCEGRYAPKADPPVIPMLRVCGGLASAAVAARMQDQLRDMLVDWQFYVFTKSAVHVGLFCPPVDFTIISLVYGEESGTPEAYYEPHCSSHWPVR